MLKPVAIACLAALPVAATAQEKPPSAHGAHWAYEGPEDPAHWSKLSADFVTCGLGHEQSPIDIVTAKAPPVPKEGFAEVRLDATVRRAPVDIVNNGHTVQVDAVGSEILTIASDSYFLQQFHFHSPSEHTVDGRSYPLEVHFVHKSEAGKLAVIGVLFEEGPENTALAPFWRSLPKAKGGRVDLGREGVKVGPLLPARHDVYRYAGSLTTPPCSEAVTWFVMEDKMKASAAQIAAMRAIVHVNNRPVQPLLGRAVYKDTLR